MEKKASEVTSETNEVKADQEKGDAHLDQLPQPAVKPGEEQTDNMTKLSPYISGDRSELEKKDSENDLTDLNGDVVNGSHDTRTHCETDLSVTNLLLTNDENFTYNLMDLPAEILLHITSFLDSRTLIKSLSKTCQFFSDYFDNELYWKSRTCHRWPKPYPIFQRDEFSWREAYIAREEAVREWMNPEDNFYHLVHKKGCYGSIDIVHLMKDGRYLATGSRDRQLNLLDLSKVSEDSLVPPDLCVFNDAKTHKGWVWSMASHDTTLVTGSWDTRIRFWRLGESALEWEQEKRLKSAVLSLYYEPGFVAAGCFDNRLYMFDPRAPEANMIRKLYHSRPVLSVAADDKYVITGSEDKTITIYDRAAGKKFKNIQTDSFIMNMSYGNGQLWTGDKEGKLHVLNTTDGLFDEHNMQTLDVDHSGQLSSVIHTEGAVYTSSTNGGIKVIHPTLEPDIICSLNVHSGPVARLSYKNGILASAGSDVSVGIWIPKNQQFK